MSAQRQSQSGLARAPQPRAEHPKVGVSRQIDDFSACCSAPTPFVVVGLQIDIIYEHGGYKLPLAPTCGNFGRISVCRRLYDELRLGGVQRL